MFSRKNAFVLANRGQALFYNENGGSSGTPFLDNVYKAFGFSPDSRYFLYLKARGNFPTFDLYCYDQQSGMERKVTEAAVHNAEWSPTGLRFAYYSLDSEHQAHISIYDLADGSDKEIAAGNLRLDSLQWSPDGAELLYVSVQALSNRAAEDKRFGATLHRRFLHKDAAETVPNVLAARFVDGQLMVLTSDGKSQYRQAPNPKHETIETFVVSGGEIYAGIVENDHPVVKRWNASENSYETVSTGSIHAATSNGVVIRELSGNGMQYKYAGNGAFNTSPVARAASNGWKMPFDGWAYVVQGGSLYSNGACSGTLCFLTAHYRQLGYALDWQQRPEENHGNTHVLASGDGTVVAMTNTITCNSGTPACAVGWDDYSATCNDFNNGAGNYVAIAHLDGTYSFYGHLKSGSVQVIPGQPVLQGSYLADQGHSGVAGTYNTYLGCGDHLHFSRQVGPAVWDQSIPTAFTETPCLLGCPAAYRSANTEIASTPALISVTPANGVDGSTLPVTLTGSKFVYGSTVSVSGSGITVSNVSLASSSQLTCTLTIAAGTAAGTYDLLVTTPNGTSNTIPFIVGNQADFVLSPTPGSRSISPGTNSTFTVNVSALNGFAGIVALTASGLPEGATASFVPSSVAAGSSAVMTVTVGTATIPGSYPLTIAGEDGVMVRTTTVMLTVPNSPDFSITASPPSQTLATGSSVLFGVSVMPVNGPTGTVALSISGLPAGVTAGFSTTAISGGRTSTLTVTAGAGAAAGVYSLTVTGTATGAAGTVVRTAGVAVTVTAAGVGGALSGSLATPSGTQQLTTLGNLDWAHWGHNGIAGQFDHKAGVSQQISNVTAVGEGSVSAYSGNPIGYSWSDGTPTVSANATTTGLYVAGQYRGFRLTAPADTTQRTLRLFVGVFNTQGQLTAHLSDGSAADYVNTGVISSSTRLGLYTLNYRAASAGQTITITYIQAGATGNVTLQAAALSGNLPNFSLSATPAAQFVVPGANAAYTVTVTAVNGFADNVTLSVSGLPAGATGTFAPTSVAGSGPSTLTIVTTGATALGSYPLTITGTSGALTRTASVTLNVTAAGVSGTLAGSVLAPSGTQQLTAMGSLDWAHWGLTSTAINRKASVTPLISNFTVVGSGTATRYTGNPIGFTWTDGTPTASATATTTGVYKAGLNTGFTISAPADTSVRTLQVFVGAWNTQGRFVAQLSDGSAPDFIDTSLVSTTTTVLGMYTLSYNAALPGQTLTVTYTQNTSSSGNVTLQAATLIAGTPSPDFSVSATPATQSIAAGAGTSYTVNVGALNGFTGNVSLSVSGLPAGATGTFAPTSVTGSGSSTLTISTTGATAIGGYPLTITGTNGALTRSASVTLNVTAPPDFSVAATPATQSVVAGASISYTVNIGALNGFTGNVALSISGLPAGATPAFAPTSVAGSGSSTLTIATTVATTPGSHPLTITGTSGALTRTAGVTLNVLVPGAGTLTGSIATPSGTQNLTTLGTTDWAHWGLTNATSFNRKAAVTQQISNYTLVGSGPVNRYTSNPTGYTWTDGTPTLSATATTTGVWVAGQNNGFRITVPAGITAQTVNVFVGVWRGNGKLVAHLSDNSAPDYVDTSLVNVSATTLGVYTIRYNAASNGQTLTITYTKNDVSSGNITLQAATVSP